MSLRKLVADEMIEQRERLDFTEKQVVIMSEDMKRMIDKTTDDLHREATFFTLHIIDLLLISDQQFLSFGSFIRRYKIFLFVLIDI